MQSPLATCKLLCHGDSDVLQFPVAGVFGFPPLHTSLTLPEPRIQQVHNKRVVCELLARVYARALAQP